MGTPKMKPRILIWDIETAPILGYVWSIWEQNVGLNQIASDWHLLSWAAKWFGAPASSVMYMDQRNAHKIEDDKAILKGLWKLLDEADIVITQNGKSFDTKKTNARFILNGMKPPSPYRHIDTKQLAKKHFAFTSNKLEYMADKLCTKYKKLRHKEFAGFDLWKECLAGNRRAWNEMKLYNIHDVLALEELYTKLAPWGTGVNFDIYEKNTQVICNCGSTDFERRGYHFTATAKYRKLKCRTCGAWSRGKENLVPVEHRKAMKRDL